MKRLLTAAGITGAVMLAALAVAPTFIDWNGYRGTIAAELSRATGRTVSLTGPIEATLLPSPRILANNVGLSGPDADGGDLLRLRAVELQVGLLPLLTGHIVVERLTLVRPEILVETDEHDRLTWVMDGAGGDLLPDVALQRFAISDGTLVWRDRERGVRARVEKIALNLAADSLSGPAKAEGSAQIDGVPVRFTAAVGRSNGKLPMPFNVALEASGLHAKGEFVGQYLSTEGRITGRLKANAGDGRAALAALLGGSAAEGMGAALIAHPASVEARVAATARAVDLNDVVVSVADQRAMGSIRARVGDSSRPTAVEATFSSPSLDLDRLATAPPLPVSPDSAPATLPREVQIALAFTSDAMLAAGKPIRSFVLEGALNDGVVAIERLEGQLPGAGSFRVAGTIAAGERLRFAGTVDARAANLRDLLAWLDVDPGPVPSGRLANARLNAKLTADSARAEFADVDLHLDSTRAHGAARIDYRDRPGLHFELAADHLDLDAYIGDGPQSSAQSAPGASSGLSGEGRFTVERLTYRGIDMREVDLTTTIAGGAFSIARFSGSPPEPGDFMADRAGVLADVPLVETRNPASAAQTDQSATAPEQQPIAEAQPAAPSAASEPGAATAENRDSFVRGILDFLGR